VADAARGKLHYWLSLSLSLFHAQVLRAQLGGALAPVLAAEAEKAGAAAVSFKEPIETPHAF
jgi:hypothetical protein